MEMTAGSHQFGFSITYIDRSSQNNRTDDDTVVKHLTAILQCRHEDEQFVRALLRNDCEHLVIMRDTKVVSTHESSSSHDTFAINIFVNVYEHPTQGRKPALYGLADLAYAIEGAFKVRQSLGEKTVFSSPPKKLAAIKSYNDALGQDTQYIHEQWEYLDIPTELVAAAQSETQVNLDLR